LPAFFHFYSLLPILVPVGVEFLKIFS